MDDFPSLDWQAERLRVTAFPASSSLIEEVTWWAEMTNIQPEEITRRRSQGLFRQVGPFETGQLNLTIQPGRINWLFAPIEGDERSIDDFPVLGSFENVLDMFLPLMRRWLELETRPMLNRLAFGAVLLYPVENRQIGYEQLDSFLPTIELDTEGVSDFQYQINRPRPSNTQIEGLEINRLSKWSVAATRQVHVQMRGDSVGGLSGNELSACRLELDMNTSQYFQGELVPNQLPEVFDELINLGREIVRRGDIR
jgi:hypothetical protein